MNSNSPSLSLCMIVKNEAYYLGRCLDAVRDHVQEIIVVDTGSTDATVDIARERGAQIYHFDWIDDFSAARNFSIEQATGDWILVLDADEWVEERHMREICAGIADTDHDALFLIQRNYGDNPLEKDWVPRKEQTPYTGNHLGYRPNPIVRLFRNGAGLCFQGKVHEMVVHPSGQLNTATLQVPLHHHIDNDPTKPVAERQRNYLRIMARALENTPDGRLAAHAAKVCMYFEQDYQRAARYFQMAVDCGYEVQENLEGLAEARYRLGEFDEAYVLYQDLHQQGHRSFSLCNNLANLCVKKDEFGRAASLLREALDLGVLHGENAERLRHNIDYLQGRASTTQ